MLTALRRSLNEVLLQAHPVRKPALRRADSDAWLLCTDIPQLLDFAALAQLTDALTSAGWRMQLQNAWLYLDHDLPTPAVPSAPSLSGEAACVASLLMRHPDTVQDADALRALCKAHEMGPAQVERVCRRLHGQYAAALRGHQPLPGLLLPYLLRSAHFEEETP